MSGIEIIWVFLVGGGEEINEIQCHMLKLGSMCVSTHYTIISTFEYLHNFPK